MQKGPATAGPSLVSLAEITVWWWHHLMSQGRVAILAAPLSLPRMLGPVATATESYLWWSGMHLCRVPWWQVIRHKPDDSFIVTSSRRHASTQPLLLINQKPLRFDFPIRLSHQPPLPDQKIHL